MMRAPLVDREGEQPAALPAALPAAENSYSVSLKQSIGKSVDSPRPRGRFIGTSIFLPCI